jgi:signal transduction histidine kinase
LASAIVSLKVDMKFSLTLKLILAFLIVSVTGLALASGFTYWQTVNRFTQLVVNQARATFVTDATFYYQTNGTWNGVLEYFNQRNAVEHINPAPPNSQLPGTGNQVPPNAQSSGPSTQPTQPKGFAFLLADVNGVVLVPAGTYAVGDTVPAATLKSGTAVTVNGSRVGTVLSIGNGPALGSLESDYLSRTNQALLYAALGAAAVALILGVILTRTLTHPLREMTTAIRLMAKGDLKQHVQVKSRDELGELAAAFNQMSTDLDQSNQARRQMTADIAHDLRTPLTVIGGYVESMHDGVLKPTPERLEAIHSEVQHLQHLVDDLRTLSLADTGELDIQRVPVAPRELLERIFTVYCHQAEQQKINLLVDAPEDLPEIHVDPARMEQVLRNLVSNALRYTPEGGEIKLSVRQEEEYVLLIVRDNGAGMTPDVLPHIFERSYRGDPARGGEESGLGLAIARSIVELHGASISAGSPGKNKGSEFVISFQIQ